MNDQTPPSLPEPTPAAARSPGATEVMRFLRAPSRVLGGIFVLLLLYTVYFAQDVLVPIAIAVVFNMLLAPLVLTLKRRGVPEALGAALVMAVLLAVIGLGVYGLAAPAGDWIERAPRSIAKIERTVRSIKRDVGPTQELTKQVENLAAAASPTETPARTVRVQEKSLGQVLVAGTTKTLAQVAIIIILLYFLLASGDQFTRRLVRAMGTESDRQRAIDIAREVKQEVSAYLGTCSLVYFGQAVLVALAMWAIGMPNPVLWGVLSFFLEFIPFAGALLMVVVLTLVSVASFDDPSRYLVAPLVFYGLAAIQANLVLPAALGRRLTLNPAVVFVSLTLWGWMWGIPGAFLAVPFLVILKGFADHIDAWRGMAIFLGKKEP